MCLNVMLTLPPPLYTPAVLVTVLRTCQTTLCHIFAHQLWARLTDRLRRVTGLRRAEAVVVIGIVRAAHHSRAPCLGRGAFAAIVSF